jgi:hypothetical protein
VSYTVAVISGALLICFTKHAESRRVRSFSPSTIDLLRPGNNIAEPVTQER